jgi:hypothetical protein
MAFDHGGDLPHSLLWVNSQGARTFHGIAV